MTPNFASGLSTILPASVVAQIGRALTQAGRATSDASSGACCLTLTEKDVPADSTPLPWEGFLVVVSRPFSGLLMHRVPRAEARQRAQLPAMQQIYLTFEPSAIADFVAQVTTIPDLQPHVREQLQQLGKHISPNDAQAQSAFTIRLLNLINDAGLQDSPTAEPALPPECVGADPNHPSIAEQVQQERILNQVTSQIRQSIELSQILTTTVEQVRQALGADRVVIYEFNQTALAELERQSLHSAPLSQLPIGQIRYEARHHPTLPSVLNLTEEAYCFVEGSDYREKYRQGNVLSVADVKTQFVDSPCLVGLLRRAQVRAKLVVPIIVQGNLWGLLIAHQTTPRQWRLSEQSFLQEITEQLAIAIHQANLYAQLQDQKILLEKFTEQRTQELYDALEAAEAASLAKSEFLALVSHELRTPLTCIIGMTNTLMRMQTQPSPKGHLAPERVQQYLSTIQTSGEHLLQLVNDILEISDVEAGRAVLNLQTFSLNQLARECLQLCQESAHRRQILLEFDNRLPKTISGRAETTLDMFCADARRVRQILLNLLSNAIKFTPTQGQVTLRLWREDHLAVFQVEDTGIGIAEEQRSLLFRKFQQIDMSVQRAYEGLGLGLALTKHLIDLHGGRVDVESVINVGSTFTVWLPDQQLERSSVSPAAAPACKLESRRERVALIEGDEMLADLICNLLTTAGYQVIWMINALMAVPQIEISQPALVLLSSQPTDMSAQELLQELQMLTLETPPKVLMLLQPGESLEKWLAAGAMDGFAGALTQPEQLLTKVAACLESGNGG